MCKKFSFTHDFPHLLRFWSRFGPGLDFQSMFGQIRPKTPNYHDFCLNSSTCLSQISHYRCDVPGQEERFTSQAPLPLRFATGALKMIIMDDLRKQKEMAMSG